MTSTDEPKSSDTPATLGPQQPRFKPGTRWSAPSPADDTLREQITEVLTELLGDRFGERDVSYAVNELLPLVQREREGAAAKALTDAADWLTDMSYGGKPVLHGYGARKLRDRGRVLGWEGHRRG